MFKRVGLTKDTALNMMSSAALGNVTVELYDIVLVMSDGVYENLGMATIEQVAATMWSDDCGPDALAEELVNRALVPWAPKPDDTTCVAAYVMNAKWKSWG